MYRISEVQQRESRNEKTRLPDIPVSPDTTPRKPSAAHPRPTSPVSANDRHAPSDHTTPTKVPLKGMDGPSPHSQKALRRRETDTDTLVSDRQSVMSFAFKGADQIRPTQRRVKASNNPSGTTTTNPSGLTNRAGYRGSAPMPKMTPSAANAKFANRLRSPDILPVHEDHDHEHLLEDGDKDATIRPHTSKARRSLPPAMALKPSTNLPEQGLRNGTLLNPPRIVSHGATPLQSMNRGIKGSVSTPPSSNGGVGVGVGGAPMAGRNISAATAKRLSMKAAEQARETATTTGKGIPESPIPDGNDSSMALWAVYGAANGSEVNTPRRTVVAGTSTRQLGGRI